jgi:hypothetical protein
LLVHVSVRTPAPFLVRLPLPSIASSKVRSLERLKISEALLVMLSVIDPLVPPFPI